MFFDRPSNGRIILQFVFFFQKRQIFTRKTSSFILTRGLNIGTLKEEKINFRFGSITDYHSFVEKNQIKCDGIDLIFKGKLTEFFDVAFERVKRSAYGKVSNFRFGKIFNLHKRQIIYKMCR